MNYGENSRLAYVSSIFFYLMLLLVPLSASSYFASYTDLVKASVIKITGGFYLIVVLYLLHRDLDKGIIKVSLKIPDILVLSFFAVLSLSTIFSINPEISFIGQYYRQIGLLLYIYLVLIYFLAFYRFNEDNITKFFRLVEFSAFVVSLYSVLQVLSLDIFSVQPHDQSRPLSTLGSPVFLGGFLVCILPFSLLNLSGWKSKIIRYLLLSAIFIAIILSGTRSAYIALIVQLLTAFIIYFSVNRNYRKIKYFLFFLFIFIITVLVFIIIFPENLYVKRLTSVVNWSENPRIILWRDSFGIFQNYPLTGCGLGTFPRAFEDFYSYELRMAEIQKYFDNPHNNFLNYLYSAGVGGFLVYTAMLLYGFLVSAKAYFSKLQRIQLAFTMFFSGYFVYGLTNFDDVTILFYFFIFFSLFRLKCDLKSLTEIRLNRYISGTMLVIILTFSVYFIIRTINELRADRLYKEALININNGNTKEAVNKLNEAITITPWNSVYRYELAAYVLDICSGLKSEDKGYLLKQVSDEISRARKNYLSNVECDELLSMFFFESGDIENAEKMKYEILDKDSVNINYRLRLADFYIRSNMFKEAARELDLIYRYHPYNLRASYLGARFGHLIKDRKILMRYCNIIFSYRPDDPYARKLIESFSNE